MAMQEVDKNIAIKPVSEPVRAAACQFEASAVAGGRKGEGLYFPVSLDDGTTVAGPNRAAGGDALERGACISLLIPEIGPPLPKVRGNARKAWACISLLIRERDGARGPPIVVERRRAGIYRSLPIQSRARNPSPAESLLCCAKSRRLPKYIAAHKVMPQRPQSGHQLTAIGEK
jgi:hypothetical protein